MKEVLRYLALKHVVYVYIYCCLIKNSYHIHTEIHGYSRDMLGAANILSSRYVLKNVKCGNCVTLGKNR